jgi:hypothetical protein
VVKLIGGIRTKERLKEESRKGKKEEIRKEESGKVPNFPLHIRTLKMGWWKKNAGQGKKSRQKGERREVERRKEEGGREEGRKCIKISLRV